MGEPIVNERRRAMRPAWRGILLALAVGVLLRVIWILLVPVLPVSDAAAYDQFAKTIWHHGVYGFSADQPYSYWPVGTGAMYAGLYAVFGDSGWVVAGWNLLLAMAMIVLGGLAGTIWFGRRVGIVTASLIAVWPVLIQFVTVHNSEVPFSVCVLGATLFWRPDRRRWILMAIVAGILLAAAAYLRPLALLIPVVLATGALIRRADWLRTLGHAAIASGVMIALLLPWGYRNQRVLGEFVLISTNGGPNLWMGNHPGTDGTTSTLPADARSLPEVERDRVLRGRAIRWIQENPAEFLRLIPIRFLRTHDRESIGVVWNRRGLDTRLPHSAILPLKVVSSLYWWAVLLLAATGILASMNRFGWLTGLAQPPVLIWGYFAAVHAVMVGGDRYHISSNPFIASLAALAIVTIGDRFVRSRQP